MPVYVKVCTHVYAYMCVCTCVLRKGVSGDLEKVREFNIGHSRYVKGTICHLFLHRPCKTPVPPSPSQSC